MAEPLADGFPEISFDEWREKATGDDPSVEVVTELEDGVEAKWLYTREDELAPDPAGLPREKPFVRGTRAGRHWQVRQTSDHPERTAANREILEDLMGGVTEVTVRFDEAARRGFDPSSPEFIAERGIDGTAISTLDDLSEVLQGVFLDVAGIALDAGASFLPAAGLLAGLWQENGIGPDQALGSFRADPIGTLARDGSLPFSPEEGLALAAGLAVGTSREYDNVRSLGVDTSIYAEGGATAAWELAIALSTGLEHLRATETAGLGPGETAAQIEFTLDVGPDQFLEMAKFRAIRRLWSRVLEECGVAEGRRFSATYAHTSHRMMTWIDPWVNMIRVTTAGFAAGAAGADGLTITPFDQPLGHPGYLGRRIARNTQTILQDEASLGRLADPLAGSWYGESLTDQLARAAWERFQAIEAEGGMLAALASGMISGVLAEAADHREEEMLHREKVMTGVNEFPILAEDGVERVRIDRKDLAARDSRRLADKPGVDCSSLTETDPDQVLDRAVSLAVAGARIDEIQDALATEETDFDALKLRPDAAPFQRLRLAADAFVKQHGENPKMYLACMGPISSHVAQANWAKSFFESGGIETVPSGPLPGNDELAEKFKEGGFKVAAVCAGKDAEPEQVKDLVEKLRQAGAVWVYMVNSSPELNSVAGADEVVKDGVDMLEVLGGALGMVGVQ